MPDDLKPMEQETQATEKAAVFPRPYQKPILEELGDLRSVTLGYSNSIGESGREATHGDFPID